MMADTRHPELHVNEEPRNDFADVGAGMIFSVSLFLIIGIIMTILSLVLN